MTRPRFALLGLILIVVAAYAHAQPGRPDDAGGDAGGRDGPDGAAAVRARADAEARDWQNLSAERREMARERAEAAGLFSLFRLEAGNVTGRFVNFSYDDETGTIEDYRVGAQDATLYVESVALSALGGAPAPQVNGAVFRVVGEEAALAVHNNPTGQIHVQAMGNDTLTVTFTLAPGANVTEEANGTARLTLGNQHAHFVLTGEGDLSVEEDAVEATLERGGGVVLLVHPPAANVRAAALHEQIDALRQGRLGGVLSVVAVDGDPAAESASYGVSMRPLDVGERSARVSVESENATGRAVVVNLDASILANASPQAVNVTLDGAPLRRVATAAEVLAAEEGLGTAANASEAGLYHVALVGGATQVTAYVPHFSERVLEITATDDGTGTDGTGTDGGAGTDGTGTDGAGTPPPADSGDADTPAPGAQLALAVLVAVALGRRRARRS